MRKTSRCFGSGQKNTWSIYDVNRYLLDTEKHHSSMLNDIERGRKTKIEFVNGIFVERGKKHQISTPVNETIVRLMKFMEARER
jgi:ketopantoate reductase